MTARLLARWRNLAGLHADPLGEALIRAYAEPHRRYHGLSHIEWLLNEAERRADVILDPRLIGYAIWFHDAIYQPEEGDNEARSAEWARNALADDPLAEPVARLIEKTKKHAAGEADADEALFLDMDMAILGAPWEAYCVYAAGVRQEYSHVVDPAFAAGRGAFLAAQLARPRIFRTDLYENEIGALARENMAWEMAEMRYGRMVKAEPRS